MTHVQSLLSKLRESDAQFLSLVMKGFGNKNKQIVEEIKVGNDSTKMEWQKQFRDRSATTIGKTGVWVDGMNTRREQWSRDAVQDFAKKLRAKNAETLTRLAKDRRKKPAYLASLKDKFEATAVETIEKERRRLQGEDTHAQTKGSEQLGDHRLFEKAEQNFLESYAREEEALLERLKQSIANSDAMLKKNIEEADAKFYDTVVAEMTQPSEGPSAEGFALAKYTMLVSIRDKKRQTELEAWIARRDSEFMQVRRHIDADNARILTDLGKQFETVLGALPKDTA